MTIDADPPTPPELDAGGDVDDYDDVTVSDTGDEYRRGEIEAHLRDGAWERAFEEWAAETDLDDAAFDVVTDLGMIAEFDFFWDDVADRIGFHAPGLPEDWRERDLHDGLESWETASGINAAMADLGRTVADVLEADYVDWETEADLPDDLPDFE